MSPETLHTISVDADTARFTMTIENIPSENPRTGKSVAPSTVAALRAGIGTESRYPTDSGAEKNFAAVQITRERDSENEPQQMGNKEAHAEGNALIKPGLHVTTHESQSKWFETRDSVNEINCNGISADPYEDGGPQLPAPDII